MTVSHRYGIPYRMHGRMPRFHPCFKGFEYVYSLSRQGQSYVKWLRDRKPLEDIVYFTLLKEVMMALPEDLRHTIGTLGALRAGYRYHGPTRQLKLFDNPVGPLVIAVLQSQALQTENERLRFESLKAELKTWCGEERAKRAELELILLATVFLWAVVMLVEQLRKEREENEGLKLIIRVVKLFGELVAKAH